MIFLQPLYHVATPGTAATMDYYLFGFAYFVHISRYFSLRNEFTVQVANVVFVWLAHVNQLKIGSSLFEFL